MRILINWVLDAIAILLTAYLLPGIHVENFVSALVIAVVLGIINATLRPVLLILTFPITILTLGLFALVINSLLILLAAQIVPGFQVDGFWWALLFSIILSLVNSVLHSFGNQKQN